MKPVAAVVTWSGGPLESHTRQSLKECGLVGESALVCAPGISAPVGEQIIITAPRLWSKSSVVDILKWFERTSSEYLLWVLPGAPLLSRWGLERLMSCTRDADAALAYGDYFELEADGTLQYHPLIDYQTGSLRDDFDFGSVVLLNRQKLSGVLREVEKDTPSVQYGGWYDLRLRLLERGQALHLCEPLYQVPRKEERPSGEKVFGYLDPVNRDYQTEMETVATQHLQRIGAFLGPRREKPLPDEGRYPVEASVVIPVKNRTRTIADSVRSALSQKTSFDFNVIVVDNHSTDGTTEILKNLSGGDKRLIHLIPERRDLVIGGCWNEAVFSKHCGRIAVQLDSDDLYDGAAVLERMVREFYREPSALVIGSYTTVDFDLQPLPPGLVDHREWTDSNGHNNALRIAGLGAPRAFHVPTLRSMGFPNVSYGEDYAIVLKISRTFRVGRIYDSLYWCRRWEGNSDSQLSLELMNRYASYKDRIRTIEIAARRKVAQTECTP